MMDLRGWMRRGNLRFVGAVLAVVMVLASLAAWTAPAARAEDAVPVYGANTDVGITAVFKGDWNSIGQSDVMLLGDLGLSNAEVTVNGNEKGKALVQVYRDVQLDGDPTKGRYGGYLTDAPGDYITLKPLPQWHQDTPLSEKNTYNSEQGIGPVIGKQFYYKDYEVSLSITLRWANGAMLKDGTLCDVVMTLSDFSLEASHRQRIRANAKPMTEIVSYYNNKPVYMEAGASEEYMIMYGSDTALNGASAVMVRKWDTSQTNSAYYIADGRPDDDIHDFAARTTAVRTTSDGYVRDLGAPGIGYNVEMKVVPRGADPDAYYGDWLEQHGANTMVFSIQDLDVFDRAYNGKTNTMVGDYAESAQLISGVKGPVYLTDPTYIDLNTMETSDGTWYKNSSKGGNNGQGGSKDEIREETMTTGLITLVDPAGFVYRWRAGGAQTNFLSSQDFMSKLRVMNVGAYPNAVGTTDEQSAQSTEEMGDIKNADLADRATDAMRLNPTWYDATMPATELPDQSDADRSSVNFTYEVPFRGHKTIAVEAREGYHLDYIAISDGIDNETNLALLDLTQKAVTVNKDQQTAGFPEITFGDAGTYVYSVREFSPEEYNANHNNDRLPGMTYSTEEYTVTVTVAADKSVTLAAKKGEANVTVSDNTCELAFTNTYDAGSSIYTLHAEKRLNSTGNWLMLDDDMFTFEIQPVAGSANAAIAPMPSGGRTYTTGNREVSVVFAGTNGGLKFTTELFSSAVKDADGVARFMYDIREVVPEVGETISINGTPSRVLEKKDNHDGTCTVRVAEGVFTYDTIVHRRTLEVSIVNDVLIVRGTHANGDDYYVAQDGTHVDKEGTHTQNGGAPVFVNSFRPLTALSGVKVWNDGNAEEDRPDSVTVRLLTTNPAGGTRVCF